MAGPKRTVEQREMDLQRMAQLLRRGVPKGRIAEALGVAPSQVTYDWKILLKRLAAARDEDTAAIRDAKAAELAEVKAEAWEAWERSKANKERQTREKAEGGGGGDARVKAVVTTEGRLPEAAYLRVVQDCIEAEREMYGLDAPVKLAGAGPVGELLVKVIGGGASVEDL